MFDAVSLVSNASAEAIYQDLHLVPSYAAAHGAAMSIAFVLVMPLGALLIRGMKGRVAVAVHVSCQLVGWALMLGGLATGIRVGKILDRLHNNPHTILGTIIVAALLLQPFIGYIHHRRFMSTQRRTAWTYLHIWYGRILILVGIINGGLGLQLAANTMAGKIVYGVIAGIVGAAYCIVMVLVELRMTKVGTTETSEMALEERSKQSHP
ncbi:hypothetical protein AJ80_02137 [Polytolypa hystricis UAMH7299]|uniref:Cytochrome b561 domain-containing protein n=1 Tax=Polytolypa hystricis (strain UAMH7299) TaxID=1447883 RepID=A0A2B7YSL8_POLH7|nr:hypothetical protein AJ80_02137 [Polytolypa hystricis UAMH7299]